MSDTVGGILTRMTIEQRVGQMFCLGFSGTYPYPDILDMVRRHSPAGFRVTPTKRKFARCFSPDHPGAPRVTRDPETYERKELNETWPALQARAAQADIVVATGWYNRGSGITSRSFARLGEIGKPLVFVTNSPYAMAAGPGTKTVVVTFSPMAESMGAAADALTGRAASTANLAFDPARVH